MTHKTYIIAEAGVNHNGSINMAHKLIDEASEIGADAIKFQQFKAEKLVTINAQKTDYQNRTAPDSETQYELLKSLELPESAYISLKDHCDDQGVDFLVTPFDIESLEFLLKINIAAVKLSSGDLTFGPLLLRAGQSGKPVILSTGMANLGEIEDALAVLAYGHTYPNHAPRSLDEVHKFYNLDAQERVKSFVTVLHCTSEYPAPIDEINLRAMQTIANQFKISVGYSDHSEGVAVPPLAVAMGASIIEKHITLDRDLSGPDHAASLDVAQFSEMVRQIRYAERIIGSKIKAPSAAELKNKSKIRRGIYAKRNIKSNAKIQPEDLCILRPCHSTSPMYYWDTVQQYSRKNYKKYESI